MWSIDSILESFSIILYEVKVMLHKTIFNSDILAQHVIAIPVQKFKA